MHQRINLDALFSTFGVNIRQECAGLNSHQAIKEKIEELKNTKLKSAYKKMALELHPDVNNGDDTKMKELNHLWELVKSVEYRPNPLIVRRIIITQQHPTTTYNTSTSTSTTTSINYYTTNFTVNSE